MPMKENDINKSVADSLEMDTGMLPFVPSGTSQGDVGPGQLS
jgi:hypothetical protein